MTTECDGSDLLAEEVSDSGVEVVARCAASTSDQFQDAQLAGSLTQTNDPVPRARESPTIVADCARGVAECPIASAVPAAAAPCASVDGAAAGVEPAPELVDTELPAADLPMTLTLVSSADGSRKRVELKPDGVQAVRVGRAAKNELVFKNNGISWHHIEIKVRPRDAERAAGLVVRDLSTNGTGVMAGGAVEAVRLLKDTDTPLEDGSIIILPMKVKVDPGSPGESRGAFAVFQGENVPNTIMDHLRAAISCGPEARKFHTSRAKVAALVPAPPPAAPPPPPVDDGQPRKDSEDMRAKESKSSKMMEVAKERDREKDDKKRPPSKSRNKSGSPSRSRSGLRRRRSKACRSRSRNRRRGSRSHRRSKGKDRDKSRKLRSGSPVLRGSKRKGSRSSESGQKRKGLCKIGGALKKDRPPTLMSATVAAPPPPPLSAPPPVSLPPPPPSAPPPGTPPLPPVTPPLSKKSACLSEDAVKANSASVAVSVGDVAQGLLANDGNFMERFMKMQQAEAQNKKTPSERKPSRSPTRMTLSRRDRSPLSDGKVALLVCDGGASKQGGSELSLSAQPNSLSSVKGAGKLQPAVLPTSSAPMHQQAMEQSTPTGAFLAMHSGEARKQSAIDSGLSRSAVGLQLPSPLQNGQGFSGVPSFQALAPMQGLGGMHRVSTIPSMVGAPKAGAVGFGGFGGPPFPPQALQFPAGGAPLPGLPGLQSLGIGPTSFMGPLGPIHMGQPLQQFGTSAPSLPWGHQPTAGKASLHTDFAGSQEMCFGKGSLLKAPSLASLPTLGHVPGVPDATASFGKAAPGALASSAEDHANPDLGAADAGAAEIAVEAPWRSLRRESHCATGSIGNSASPESDRGGEHQVMNCGGVASDSAACRGSIDGTSRPGVDAEGPHDSDAQNGVAQGAGRARRGQWQSVWEADESVGDVGSRGSSEPKGWGKAGVASPAPPMQFQVQRQSSTPDGVFMTTSEAPLHMKGVLEKASPPIAPSKLTAIPVQGISKASAAVSRPPEAPSKVCTSPLGGVDIGGVTLSKGGPVTSPVGGAVGW